MILRPQLSTPPGSDGISSAWQAIARTQRAHSPNYLLVHQPDHARLAGELAEQFSIPGRPAVSEAIVTGISLHDEGWSMFDSGAEKLQATPAQYTPEGVPVNGEGKPLSFSDIKAADFLRAWCASIEAAEAVTPIAGLIVSGHFYRLGKFGAGIGHYSGDDVRLVQQFIAGEERRRERLSQLESRSPAEIEYWTDVLQFCDLLSLYLCCGSQESVEFPQRIGDPNEAMLLRVKDGLNVLSPSPLEREAKFTLTAHSFPQGADARLNWKVR